MYYGKLGELFGNGDDDYHVIIIITFDRRQENSHRIKIAWHYNKQSFYNMCFENINNLTAVKGIKPKDWWSSPSDVWNDNHSQSLTETDFKWDGFADVWLCSDLHGEAKKYRGKTPKHFQKVEARSGVETFSPSESKSHDGLKMRQTKKKEEKKVHQWSFSTN